ncbi:MAG TPA: hypothetical protein VFX70_16330, partial [Mycobacteriales bacterium]|nr:hypothetical protein [Mycobacteriales bacterium]
MNSPDPEPVTEPAPGVEPIPEPEPAVGQTGSGRIRSGHRNGYLASVAGALVGAASGGAVGLLASPVAFRYASGHLDLSPKHLDHGLADALEGVMIGVATVIVAALLVVLLVVLCA